MNITRIFERKTVFSFEVFPPKKDSPIDTVYNTLDHLQNLHPDFISVTLGAGGSGNGENTIAVAKRIQELGMISMSHLPCIHASREKIDQLLEQFQENNIHHILALRGDRIPDVPVSGDFLHASDLISYIRTKGDFDIAGACYPECHTEAASMAEDIANLKKKVDAGATHLISQLFFDNEAFFHFQSEVRKAGITVPIEAGIMPVTNSRQITRMVSMCGASLPRKFTRIIQRYENNPSALQDAGIAYAISQIIDLLAAGVDGIHLYTMNNPYVAKKISDAISGILREES